MVKVDREDEVPSVSVRGHINLSSEKQFGDKTAMDPDPVEILNGAVGSVCLWLWFVPTMIIAENLRLLKALSLLWQ